ncbi:ATP-binding cassette domain-containing protein [Candidatus Saccharibacteria bacterium]|nr:ATP-binding cassette domain-containing protein [Candidatus Saccharibacteria bacterium]
MIIDANITEKSFGAKNLLNLVRLTVETGEKIGLIGRNGIGKSTLFKIIIGNDKDYGGEVNIKRGAIIVSSDQEYGYTGTQTVLEHILAGLPEYMALSQTMADFTTKINPKTHELTKYSEALDRFNQKGYHYVEDQVTEELKKFQLDGYGTRQFTSLSGGEKRLVEVVKIMHSQADLALVDEPTNYMDYVAKEQFIKWLKAAPEAVLIITHDRDVLQQVDRIVEIRDGETFNFKGNYDHYLKQNAVDTSAQVNEYEVIQRRIDNLKVKVIDYKRLKEKARNPATI